MTRTEHRFCVSTSESGGCEIPAVPVGDLHARLRWAASAPTGHLAQQVALHDWRMELHDAPVLRYLYRNARPRRHLEFGTWQGRGALDCLEECDATVWSINLREGEADDQGRWAYDAWLDKFMTSTPVAGVAGDARGEGESSLMTRTARDGRAVVRTDALGAIGRLVHERGLGHRLSQIYCDSRDWDSSHYPDGFFDSTLIDGGHATDVVASDTTRAMRLVRPGGLIIWHDYCPDAMTQATCSSVRGVVDAIRDLAPVISRYFADWFWIKPSWLLVGVRNDRPFEQQGIGR